jgi:uncharacterized membrane protein
MPRFDVDRWVQQHWLAAVNGAAAAFAALPVLAPALLAAGWHAPALLIYGLYRTTCHQWPGRSYFLFGSQGAFSLDVPPGLAMAHDFLGTAELGFKMAYCERNFAIYTTVLAAGLAYAVLRRHVRPLPWPLFLAALLPLALDGFSQLGGWRESSWQLRSLTGALAGGAGVWLVYPRLDRSLSSSEREARSRAGDAPLSAATRATR